MDSKNMDGDTGLLKKIVSSLLLEMNISTYVMISDDHVQEL